MGKRMYQVEVSERRVHNCRYLVYASNKKEAERLAEEGDTESENDLGCDEVLERCVMSVAGYKPPRRRGE